MGATRADGTPLRYGMGVDVRQDARGINFIGHSGEITGYAARANWYPDAQMAIVVLMNNSFDSSPTAMADELAGSSSREIVPLRSRSSATPSRSSARTRGPRARDRPRSRWRAGQRG